MAEGLGARAQTEKVAAYYHEMETGSASRRTASRTRCSTRSGASSARLAIGSVPRAQHQPRSSTRTSACRSLARRWQIKSSPTPTCRQPTRLARNLRGSRVRPSGRALHRRARRGRLNSSVRPQGLRRDHPRVMAQPQDPVHSPFSRFALRESDWELADLIARYLGAEPSRVAVSGSKRPWPAGRPESRDDLRSNPCDAGQSSAATWNSSRLSRADKRSRIARVTDWIENRAEAVLSSVPDYVWDARVAAGARRRHRRLVLRPPRDGGRRHDERRRGARRWRRVKSLSGLLLVDRKQIWCNADEARQWPGRKRFTIAHELGHWVLHKPGQQSLFCRRAAWSSRTRRRESASGPGARRCPRRGGGQRVRRGALHAGEPPRAPLPQHDSGLRGALRDVRVEHGREPTRDVVDHASPDPSAPAPQSEPSAPSSA